MRNVWKHKIPVAACLAQKQAIPMGLPKGAKILSVGLQDNVPFLWEVHRVEVENETQPFIYIVCAMTGEPFDIGHAWELLGTLHMDGGTFVLHVFQELRP